MKIYTKQGDKGTTAVYTSALLRVDKDDALLNCYGTLDELNSHIGLIVSLIHNDRERQNYAENFTPWIEMLQAIQQQLFAIGFALSDSDTLTATALSDLESKIDQIQAQLPAQTTFVLPGGTLLAAHMHVTRTVARRAERQLVSVAKLHEVNDIALAYINRLSDLFFVLARYANYVQNTPDINV